ncbi:hypothetical protein VaNZ11_000247 [Volvox africanus]|uniref:Protein kinase domain-containing protein n=1 Tax=Volvox africanus TaxID=51714 RepID=A0ABQ5RM17_9CHLO|nr:hypothetical protein VaNZ11_000247 [Volvox africanus]
MTISILSPFRVACWFTALMISAVPMLCVAQPPPPAMLIPSSVETSSVNVTTGQGLAEALANPLKSFARLKSNIQVVEADFPNSTIVRSTNFTISGTSGPQTSWPVLDLNFVKGKIRLDNNTALILQYVVVQNFRATPLGQSPGFDIVASSLVEAGALVMMQDAILMLRICVPRNIQGEIMSSILRPSNLPGVQNSTSVSQAGCIHTDSSDVPPVSRCWPDLGIYVDVAVAGFDIDAFGRATATRYALYMLRVPYLCERQMTEDCVSQLGPLGCYLFMFPRTPMATPSGSTPSPSSGQGFLVSAERSSNTRTPVVAGVVAGVVSVVLVAVAVLVVRTWRQRTVARRKAVYEESRRRGAQNQVTKNDGTGNANGNLNGKLPPSHGHSPTTSQGGPVSSSVAQKLDASTPASSSIQQHPNTSRNFVLPSGVGTCVLSSSDVDASSPLVIVTPFTPHRSDLKLDVQCDTEVKLLPIIRGKGSYGRVVEGLYGGQRVAVKLVVDVDEWSGPTDSLVSSFAQEVEVLGRCQHPNVVRLLAACLKPPRLCLVMELMDTSLERLIHGKSGELLPLPMVLHIAADIARGLAYLHPTIVHRDLKPGNVLLSNTDCPRPIAKLTDFGLSRLRSTVLVTRHPEAGTPAYMAPEAFDASNYVITHKADIYALGVILWEMLTGSVPWDGCSMVAIAYSITVRHHRLPLSKLDGTRCPPKLRKLIHQCWDPDPQRRPAAAELVKQLTLVLQLVHGDCEAPSSNGSLRSNANASADNSRVPQVAATGHGSGNGQQRVPGAVTAVAGAGSGAKSGGSGGAAGISKVAHGAPGQAGSASGAGLVIQTDGSSLSSAPGEESTSQASRNKPGVGHAMNGQGLIAPARDAAALEPLPTAASAGK